MIDSGSEILLKTLQLYCFLFIGIVFVICSKKPPPPPSAEVIPRTPTGKAEGSKEVVCSPEKKADKKSKEKEKPKKEKKKVKKEKSDDDVKFDLKLKEPEKKPDEFDDDEENPLAKIPVIPRQKTKESPTKGGSTSKTPSTASPGPPSSPSPGQELEAPLFATNEKQIGSSCYVRLDC
ncbi:hypothetical protein CAEBREN_00472 [Caenorhabditis brenneri]|uniref:Uncharacterized protein n=1 Tax=Caenorhabditis brenneri TaxID=135651 RepID=G0MPY2_CAEBE|nr:hypothetical protein CAEBREN_00472 [Caenorhabditis brenneri]